MSQEKEEEVKKGVARERRIRALLTEVNELDERLGKGAIFKSQLAVKLH